MIYIHKHAVDPSKDVAIQSLVSIEEVDYLDSRLSWIGLLHK